LGLLLSDTVNQQAGKHIDELAAQAGVALQRYTLAQASANLPAVHAAFFSRELYEGSSIRKPGPLSDAFFNVVDAAPNLRWLHVCSSGLDLPQYAPSLQRGVRVTASTGTTATPIAQTVLAAILAQSRGFDHWLQAQSRKQWAPLAGRARPKEISEMRAVVAGAGAIGQEIGRLLAATGFHTIAVRRSATPTPAFDEAVALSDLDRILPQCDWLVLAMPLTAETRYLINATRLALLPRHARIVNVARGELIDETALTEALVNHKIKGAYLDTFHEEPLPESSALWTLPNVWITPHNCAASQGHEQRVLACFLQALRTWLATAHR